VPAGLRPHHPPGRPPAGVLSSSALLVVPASTWNALDMDDKRRSTGVGLNCSLLNRRARGDSVSHSCYMHACTRGLMQPLADDLAWLLNSKKYEPTPVWARRLYLCRPYSIIVLYGTNEPVGWGYHYSRSRGDVEYPWRPSKHPQAEIWRLAGRHVRS
jgi:hypothetical protein